MGSRLLQNSESVRKRIEAHSFEDEEGEEYEGSKFGGFSDYFRRKKIKLQNLDAEVRSSSTAKPQLFRGIVAHINGYTQPSLTDLHHLIVSHGGGFMQYLDGKTTVTHIIAANLTPKKAIEFRRYRMVKPAWIVDSVKSGKLLPWDSYKVIDEGSGQRLLGFDDGKIVSQANTQQRTYREQTTTGWYTSQVKNVAKHIDDRDGAQFPSIQVVPMNGTSTFMGDSAVNPKQSSKSMLKKPKEDDPSSSSGFDVTSSLEDAFKDAVMENDPVSKDIMERESDPRASPASLNRHSETRALIKWREARGLRYLSPDLQDPTAFETRLRDGNPSKDVNDISPSKKGKVLTAEEHNALLLADPHLRKSSTANPDFIKQYYSESRLHHLSMWKADLKSRFQQMAAEKSASQRQAPKRKPGARRYVMHVDFDSFFCAVSLKNAPEYVDKPAVVAHGSGPGSEIASCNYPARALGIRNGMWMKKALTLCSNIKVLPYDFHAYEEASRGFYEAILDVGGTVQSVSIDEALVDISALCLPAGGSDGVGIQEESIWREQEKADQIAETLRARIKKKTGCAVSVGIGRNILLAKVALRKAKPAGQHQINPEDVFDFIGELTVQDLPGVAWSIGGKLEEIGVKFVKDVRSLTKERLMTVLGPKTGEKIWDYSRGIDLTEVGQQVVRKSVSAEVNWGIRFISQPEAEEFVQNLCKELQRRLIEQRVKGRQLTMKIMRKAADAPLDPPKNLGHGKCDTFNKSVVLGVAIYSAEVIGREAVSILRSYGFSPGELRGLGVQMQKLEPLKSSNDTLPDGSQRRINFGVAAVPKLAKQVTEDQIGDPQTPTKPKTIPMSRSGLSMKAPEDPIDESITPQKLKTAAARLLCSDDPIDDISSPKKATSTPIHPAIAISRANASDQSAKKFLNLTGTQFIIPTQIDPIVLAELPQGIRSKLLAQSKSRPVSRSASPAIQSRSRSPSVGPSMVLPSQLDPEVFEALPEDMKAEVLATYKSNSSSSQGQSLLLQSPRKPKAPLPTKKWTPTKKRGRPPGSRNKTDANSGFKQSAFVAPKKGPFPSKDQPVESDGNLSYVLDEEFLSALPEDVRQETITEHRRKRLAEKGGLMTAITGEKRKPPEPAPLGQRRLRLPTPESRPTFTTQELSTLPQLRETLTAWHEGFEEDGPHPNDVAALERYLRRVIIDERDMSKVVSVIHWLDWLISSSTHPSQSEGTEIWTQALSGIKAKAQSAVQERGLGILEL